MIDARALARLFLLDFIGAAGLMYLIAWFFGFEEPLAWAVAVGVISALQALVRRHLKPRRDSAQTPAAQ